MSEVSVIIALTPNWEYATEEQTSIIRTIDDSRGTNSLPKDEKIIGLITASISCSLEDLRSFYDRKAPQIRFEEPVKLDEDALSEIFKKRNLSYVPFESETCKIATRKLFSAIVLNDGTMLGDSSNTYDYEKISNYGIRRELRKTNSNGTEYLAMSESTFKKTGFPLPTNV